MHQKRYAVSNKSGSACYAGPNTSLAALLEYGGRRGWSQYELARVLRTRPDMLDTKLNRGRLDDETVREIFEACEYLGISPGRLPPEELPMPDDCEIVPLSSLEGDEENYCTCMRAGWSQECLIDRRPYAQINERNLDADYVRSGISRALSALPARWAKVLKISYGLIDGRPKSDDETAGILSAIEGHRVCRTRVHKIRKKAFERLLSGGLGGKAELKASVR